MNLEEANEIVYRYEILLKQVQPTPPSPSFNTSVNFELDSVSVEDGMIRANWSRYVGCGEYDNETTYHSLNEFFKE